MSILGLGPLTPGISNPTLTAWTNQWWWGSTPGQEQFTSGPILSSTTDAGNTPTTTLRAGLLMGRINSGSDAGKYRAWNPTGTDGSQTCVGVLAQSYSTLDASGTAAASFHGWIQHYGKLRSKRLLVPGAADVSILGSAYEFMLRRQLKTRFQLDDQHFYPARERGEEIWVVTADLTITTAMNGVKFVTTGASGAVNFTLPATAYRGLVYEIVGGANQNVTITAGTADTITTLNDLAADTVVASTTNQLIGSHFLVEGLLYDATAANSRWLITNLSTGVTMTVTT